LICQAEKALQVKQRQAIMQRDFSFHMRYSVTNLAAALKAEAPAY
jgi:hypothetical protein